MQKRTVRIVYGVMVGGLLVGGSAVGTTLWSIQQSVRAYSDVAQQAHPHPGDDVASLVDFMTSPEHSLEERNRAVWTLGRLRATGARAALEATCTGEPCHHDRALCQYELSKAIARCR